MTSSTLPIKEISLHGSGNHLKSRSNRSTRKKNKNKNTCVWPFWRLTTVNHHNFWGTTEFALAPLSNWQSSSVWELKTFWATFISKNWKSSPQTPGPLKGIGWLKKKLQSYQLWRSKACGKSTQEVWVPKKLFWTKAVCFFVAKGWLSFQRSNAHPVFCSCSYVVICTRIWSLPVMSFTWHLMLKKISCALWW